MLLWGNSWGRLDWHGCIWYLHMIVELDYSFQIPLPGLHLTKSHSLEVCNARSPCEALGAAWLRAGHCSVID